MVCSPEAAASFIRRTGYVGDQNSIDEEEDEGDVCSRWELPLTPMPGSLPPLDPDLRLMVEKIVPGVMPSEMLHVSTGAFLIFHSGGDAIGDAACKHRGIPYFT